MDGIAGGKINIMGELETERGGKFKKQFCPVTDSTPCGDHCPLFEEPRKSSETKKNWTILLPLCKKTLSFDLFVDERRGK